MILDLLNEIFNVANDKKSDVKEYDFTKLEDVNAALDDLNNVKKENTFQCFGMFDDAIDCLIKQLELIKKNLENKVVEQNIEAATSATPCSCCTDVPEKPSTYVQHGKVKNRISELTDEYVNSVILPNIQKDKLNEKMVEDVWDSLYQFACWIYNHK